MNENVAETNGNVEIDYKAEYEKAIAERDTAIAEANKQKGLKDKYASENADYKKKAEAQMSEEEKRAKEWQELVDRSEKQEAVIKQMQLEKELLARGFTAQESEKLIKGNFAVTDVANIIKERVDSALKSQNAGLTKGSTPKSLMGNGTAKSEESHIYAQMALQANKPSNREEEIKKFYKK